MKYLLRPALALFVVAPLTLIGQTNTNADPSQVPKTYKELVSEIDNYYYGQFPEQANSLEDMGAGQESVNERLDEYNLNNELRDMSDASEQDTEGELYVLPEFVVSNDQDEGYYSANSTSLTRTNTLVKNSPISMSIVNEQLLDDLNILSTEDLAMVSASIDEDPNGFSLDRIRIRGFRNSFSRFNFFKRNLPSDPYNIARIDIIKGANSLIFGQASPGGSVNNAPMLANFNKNTKALSVAVGNKDYLRTNFNANQIINDNFAIRVMGVHSEQGYDHQFKSNEKDALTVATTMRLTPKTQLRMHFEGVSATNRFPNGSMRDLTEFDDSNLLDSTYDGILSEGMAKNVEGKAESNRTYQVPFSPDWVEFLPEKAMQWIIDYTEGRTNKFDGSLNEIKSRQDLRDHYASINRANYGSVSGPDRFTDRDGLFAMADFTHEINENLQLNLSMNVEQLDANSLKRDSYGSIRVKNTATEGNYQNDIFTGGEVIAENYIRTFWTKNDISTDRFGLRSALVFENDWFNAKNRMILGWDFNTQTKNERFEDQVPLGAVLADGSFLPDPVANDNFKNITSFHRAYEYISLSEPFTADRSILQFNEWIESDIDFAYANFAEGTSSETPNYDGSSRNPQKQAQWALSKTTFSQVNNHSLWFADQSEFFNGRLHTLMGLRYDIIQVESSLRKVSYHGFYQDDDHNNKASVTYEELNPTIGGLFWINDEISIFASYAQSIETPSGTERTPIAEIAPPELGQGVEFGVRFDLFSGKLDGQLCYYSIIKENDNSFAYSDYLLKEIYKYEDYNTEFPEIYDDNENLVVADIAGRRAVGDKTLSEGVELDFTYNPLPGFSVIGSYNFTIANEVLELHPNITNATDYELFGRPEHRAALTARYKFRDGALKGLTIGASQRYRSGADMTRYDLYYDADGKPVGDPKNEVTPVVRTDRVYLNFGDVHTTSAFATWEKKLGKKRSSPQLIMGLRVRNLLNDTGFTGRENFGYYGESRSYNLSAKILF